MAARTLGFDVFALENGGECLSSDDAAIKYKSGGDAQECPRNGLGANNVIHVYRINHLIFAGNYSKWLGQECNSLVQKFVLNTV